MDNSANSFILSCPVGCKSSLDSSDIVLPEGPLRRCDNCGQLVSICSEKQYWDSMEEFDDPDGTTPADRSDYKRLEKRTRRIITRAQSIVNLPPKDMRLLDVGCSTGAFISVAKKMGVNVTGVEPAAGPVKTARETGLNVHQGFLEDIKFPEGSYNIITIFEVIEHLKDPVSLMKECFRILNPGGLVVFRTGNAGSWTSRFMKARWEYFHISKHGGHISFFNPLSIRKLAEQTGFSVEYIKTHSVRFYEREDVPYLAYRTAKIFSELLNMPSTWFGKGHELLVYIRKPTT